MVTETERSELLAIMMEAAKHWKCAETTPRTGGYVLSRSASGEKIAIASVHVWTLKEETEEEK